MTHSFLNIFADLDSGLSRTAYRTVSMCIPFISTVKRRESLNCAMTANAHPFTEVLP